MRRSRLLKTQASPNICLFCACKLSGETVTSGASKRISYAQRRQISHGPPSQQSSPGIAPTQDEAHSSQPQQEGSTFTGQASWDNAFAQSDREALAARVRLQEAAEAKRQQEIRDAQDRYVSQKQFGVQPTIDQQAQANKASASQRLTGNTAGIHRMSAKDQAQYRYEQASKQNQWKAEERTRQEYATSNAQNANATRRRNNRDPKGFRRFQIDRSGKSEEDERVNFVRTNPVFRVPSRAQPAPVQKPPPVVQAPTWVTLGGTQDKSAPKQSSWGSLPARPAYGATQATQPSTTENAVESGRAEAGGPEITSESTATPAPRKDLFDDQPQQSRQALPTSAVSGSETHDVDASAPASYTQPREDNSQEQAQARQPTLTKPTVPTPSPFDDNDQLTRQLMASKLTPVQPEPTQANPEAEEQSQPRRPFRIELSEDGKPRTETYKPFDPELSANWNIVTQRRRRPEDEEGGRRGSQQPRRLTPEDIDARFEEYRQKRPGPAIDVDSLGYHRRGIVFGRKKPEERTCNRCGEKGHLSAQCTNTEGLVRRVDTGKRGDDDAPFTRGSPPTRGFRGPLVRRTTGTFDDSYADPFPSDRAANRPYVSRDRQDDSEHLPASGRAGSRNFANEPGKFGDEARSLPEEPADGQEQTRKSRSSRFEIDEENDGEAEKPARGRRGRAGEREVENDGDRDAGRRQRSRRRFDDDEDAGLDDYQGSRAGDRADRRATRQAKKEKAKKEAARKAAREARRAEELTPINLPEFISVSNLATSLGIRYEVFVSKLEELGFTATSHDHILSSENASLIAMEYGFDPVIGEAAQDEQDSRDLRPRPEPSAEDKEFLPARPPVVAIMGHVDHGKTTILDYLRKSSVAASEHGGITQHIGAFSVGLSTGKTITFLDTPGHAAFLEMRKRGANVTDVIILVVAADDSVKPQTIEAIKHAKSANVPVIVAINKVDKEEANIERVKQDLARHEVEIEDFGGDTQVVCVSGKTGQGIEELEEAIVTLSEILDHRAETVGEVEGWVLEATTKKAGRVATVLVKRGTLTAGNIVVAGKTWARVRALRNEAGKVIMSAGPGTPVEVDGWKDQPAAGDQVLQAPNEKKATDAVEYRLEQDERIKLAEDMEAINETRRLETEKRENERLAAEAAARAAKLEGDDPDASSASKDKQQQDTDTAADADAEAALSHQTVPFIVKADVSGSVEAVSSYLLQLTNPLCSPRLLRAAVGPISEFDIEHAAAAGGHIIAFNLPDAPDTLGQAERRGVKVLEQRVIYRIVDQVRAVLEDKLPPVKTQRVTGEAEVAVGFEIGLGGRKKLRVAGCKVRNGVVGRGSRVRVLRGERRVYDGTVSSLKNVKKDVQEMRKGTECGMSFDGWEDFEAGDVVQTYEEKTTKRALQL